MIEGMTQEAVWTILSAVTCDMINTRWLWCIVTWVGDHGVITLQIHPTTIYTPHEFLGSSGWILGPPLWEHVANIREHVVVWYMHQKRQGIDWNTDIFTTVCGGWIQNREQRLMQSRSCSPQLWSEVEFWICCRGHQGASHTKRITTFCGVDHQERGRQSRAAVPVTRAARDSGSRGRGRSFRGRGGHGEVPYLYRGESRVCFGL
jgi:hypothetical protein